MLIRQYEITLKEKKRGFHLITDEVISRVNISDIEIGMLHLFLKHTSASLSINENADPTVRQDIEHLFNDLCDNKAYYRHTYEGGDDMPSHGKCSILGASLNIPITNGRLNLGTWQGIYLGEHRNHGGSRTIVITAAGV
jgi:secondary thiamine-phosphate synthase enzyme